MAEEFKIAFCAEVAEMQEMDRRKAEIRAQRIEEERKIRYNEICEVHARPRLKRLFLFLTLINLLITHMNLDGNVESDSMAMAGAKARERAEAGLW